VRQRDPRRILGRRREARARVSIVDVPESASPPDGSVTTKQAADVTLPRSELDKVWHPEYLERLAHTYWRFLTRVSLGLLRVLYTDDARDIAVIGRPFVLLRFYPPDYEADDDCGTVTWRIREGFLVAPTGRTKGYLRLTVRRPADDDGQSELVTGRVTSEVANFYPLIAGWGWFARVGQHVYRITQLQIHVVVTHAFLRSLARLDLAPSVVGALASGEPVEAAEESEAARG
jgi:hypothetical protein